MAIIQSGHFGMDFGCNLIFCIHYRFNIEAHTIFPPVNGDLAISIRSRNRNTSADKDIRLLAAHSGDGRAGQNPCLTIGYQGLHRSINIGYMTSQPSQRTATGIFKIFPGKNLIDRPLFISAVSQCRSPELDAQILFIIRIDFNNLRFQAYLRRMGKVHKIYHIITAV